jgi:hypothetical protein
MYGSAEQVVGDLLDRADAQDKAFLATIVWTTGRRAGIAAGVAPTSNPSQVPQPITGSAAPDEGMARVCMHRKIAQPGRVVKRR